MIQTQQVQNRGLLGLADSCPVCGEFILEKSQPLNGKPIWYLILGIAGIIAVILVLSGLINLL